jgi:tRNA dimethylallyltransferase
MQVSTSVLGNAPDPGECSAYFLVGPTAVGKSKVAEYIAQKYGYDILSADSMQIYIGMDIGTAKPQLDVRSSISYHGVDIVDPTKSFSAGEYRQYALNVLACNAAAGRKTIVVGGTGLYIKALTNGLSSASRSDPAIRARWAQVLEEHGITALQKVLQERSSGFYDGLKDKENARRLIRALEQTEMGFEQASRTWDRTEKWSAPLAGLISPASDLANSIEMRVRRMYELGLVGEVRALLAKHGALSQTAYHAIGYAEAIDILEGRCKQEEAICRTVVRTRQLAKRQRTWFRHQADVKWVEVNKNVDTQGIAGLVMKHWGEYGPTEIEE